MSAEPLQIEGYRISTAQKRLWNLGARGLARTAIAWAPIESADGDALQRAVHALVARHEIFRTAFHRLPGMDLPLQVILDRPRCEVRRHDWRGAGDPRIRVAELRDALARRQQLSVNESLLEVHLAQTDAGALLILAAPALIADRHSLEIAIAELLGAPGEASVQYVQYSEWQHEARGTEEGEGGVKHWASVAATAAEATGVLPFQCEGVAAEDEVPLLVAHEPSAALAATLAGAASRHGVSETALLLASVAVALQTRTRAAGVRIDVEHAGRGFEELTNAPGPYAEFLPLHVSVDEKESLPALARTVDAALQTNESHQPLFDRELFDGRESARLPVGFRLRRPDGVESHCDAESFDLLFDFVSDGDALGLRALFSPARHRRETIARTLDSVALAVHSLDRETAVRDLALLGDEERVALAALHETGVAYPRAASTLDVLFAQKAAAHADAAAVWCDGREWTFRDIDRRANAIAHALHARGISRGARVCVIATRSAEQVIAILGIWKAGAAYVAIDPDNPPARKAALLEAIDAAAVLTNAGAAGTLPPLDIPVIDAEAATDTGEPPRQTATSRDAAYVIFTSGTTGVPKGVVVEHRSAVNLAEALQATVYEHARPGLRVSLNAPLTFDSSVKQLLQIVNGHCLCIVPEEDRTDGERLIDWLRRSAVDVFDCTPSHIRILHAAGLADTTDLAVRRVLVGGERIDRELWDQLAAHPSIRFYNAYGPTETTVNVSIEPIDRGVRPALGRPLPNVRVHILDERQRPVPFGVPGEICIAGAGVSRGYFGNAALTAAKFVPEPGRRGARMYRSGDRGRLLSDGRIEFLGRTDDQVKIRGFRVEPGEIEALLARHPHVGRAVVVPRSDTGDLRLVAYLSRREQEKVDGAGALARLPIGIDVAEINRNETAYLFEEIFTKRAYVQHSVLLRDDAVVFDVGANIGMFTMFVSRECARPRIFAFEPIAPIFEKLQWNASRHGRNAKVFPFGLSAHEHDDEFTFYPGYSMMSSQQAYADKASEHEVIRRYLQNEQQQGMASRDLLLDHIDELLENRFRAQPVPAHLRRLSDVIREEGVELIDLLKIDVQRAEVDVIRGIDDEHWPLIQQVVMEVHDAAGSATQGRTGELLDLLEARGFDVVIEQDPLLRGTDRYNLYAVRPAYVAEHAGSASAPQQTLDPLSTASLRAYLLERLPEHLVPSAFVVLDALPLNRHGKVDRAALPAPDAARPDLGNEAVAPENWQEEALVDIWTQVLGLRSVGVTDNFFQLGGDSIRSIQVQALAQKRGLRVSLQKLFDHQTIRELVRRTDLAALPPPAAAAAPVETHALPEGIEAVYPLAALQEGMVYHTELTGDSRTYHNVTTHRIALPFDHAKLVEAFRDTLGAHPILRTSFAMTGHERPMQRVHRAVDVEIPLTDLSSLTDDERDAAIRAAMERDLATPFDLTRPSMLRAEVFRTEADAFELLLSEYHAVLDGWSRHLVLLELVQRYARALGDAVTVADPPRLRYGRLVELQDEATRSADTREFWRELLDGVQPSPLAGVPRGGAREIRLRRVPLAGDVTAALRAIARNEQVPFKSLLMAIYAAAIASVSATGEPLIGVVMNVRPEEEDGDRVVGLFLNTLPFPLRTRGESWAALARQAFALEQRIVPHRFLPLAEVQRIAGRPLFDAFFNFTHFYDDGSAVPMTTSRITPVDVAFRVAVDFEIDTASGELLVNFQYDASAVSERFEDDFAAALRGAVEAARNDPQGEATLAAAPPASTAAPLVAAATPAPDLFLEPRTDIERSVAAVWRDVLGVEQLGVTDAFRDVGGHSLLATRIALRLREELSYAVPLSAFCDNATVGGIARFIETQHQTRRDA